MAKITFPKQFYSLIPALYPHLVDVLGSAELTLTEFCCLSIIKNSGKEIGPDVVAFPLADLKAILVRTGEYTDSGANGFITNRLQNQKRYLESRKVSPEQKKALFPNSKGYRDVLILSEHGRSRLAAVNEGVERLFQNATAGLPALIASSFLRALSPFASAVTDRLNQLSAERMAADDRIRIAKDSKASDVAVGRGRTRSRG